MAVTRQLFSNNRTQVEIVIIKYQHRVSNGRPSKDMFRRKDVGVIGTLNWLPVADANTIGTPMRAGRNHHVTKSVFQDILHTKAATEEYVYIGHLLDSPNTPIANSCPGVQAGQAALLCDPATQLSPCLGKRHSVPPLTERPCRLKTRWSSTDYQHCGVRTF